MKNLIKYTIGLPFLLIWGIMFGLGSIVSFYFEFTCALGILIIDRKYDPDFSFTFDMLKLIKYIWKPIK